MRADAPGPSSTASNGTYTNYSPADLQITGSRAYTDVGKVYDSESGALLGTFYQSGTIVAGGATTADPTLGKAFVLDSVTQYGSINQIIVQAKSRDQLNPALAKSVAPLNPSTRSARPGS